MDILFPHAAFPGSHLTLQAFAQTVTESKNVSVGPVRIHELLPREKELCLCVFVTFMSPKIDTTFHI